MTISHPPRSRGDRTRQEDRHLNFYELRDNLQARREPGESLQELRDLARGIHPAIVTGQGLAVAAESLAARSPIPVELVVTLEERVSETVEVAAYYVVFESLRNVAKYAKASCAKVEIGRSNGSLVVEDRR